MNGRVLGRGLKLVRANGGRFKLNMLLFTEDRALYSGCFTREVVWTGE